MSAILGQSVKVSQALAPDDGSVSRWTMVTLRTTTNVVMSVTFVVHATVK
jgi:hypothetical protein